jgi:galacturan 1,4-alpha-galacturonidase
MPQTSVFACSSPNVCSSIVASDIGVSSPNGTREAYCQNVDLGSLDVECTGVSKGFN